MNSIEISQYTSEWNNQFQIESDSIKSAIEFTTIYVDHVGSTSIPGLASKPIIDILISLNDWSLANKVVKKLEFLGYKVEEDLPDIPRFFLTKYNSVNYHIHLCKPDSPWAVDMKTFKAQLQQDKNLCNDYVFLKENLARKFSNSKSDYIAGKKNFIETSLRKADKEFGIEKLLTHQKAESDKAENLQFFVMVTQLLICILSAISIYIDSNKILYGVATINLLFVIIYFILNQYKVNFRTTGDQARRIALLMSGLGMNLSPEHRFYINSMFKVPVNPDELRTEESHFSTREQPSYKRLVEMIEESIYWTKELLKISGLLLKYFLFLLTGIGIILLGLAVLSFDNENLVKMARVTIAFIIFIVSADLLGLLLEYNNAEVNMNEIFRRIEVIANKNYKESDSLLLMSDYNAIIERSPIALPFAFKIVGDQLSKNWNNYLKGKNYNKFNGSYI